MPAQDVPACADSASGLPRARCSAGQGAGAESKGRFTLLMERLVINVLTECATLTGVRRIMRITWDEAWGVMERAVRRGRERKQLNPERYLGVEGKAFVAVNSSRPSQTDRQQGQAHQTESVVGHRHDQGHDRGLRLGLRGDRTGLAHQVRWALRRVAGSVVMRRRSQVWTRVIDSSALLTIHHTIYNMVGIGKKCYMIEK